MKRPKIISYLMPNFNNIVWLVTFFGVLLRGRNMMNGDGDLARHLTVGKYILDHGQVPLIDLFSHTMQGEVLTPYEWLSQITFALINRFFGLNGVIIFSALIISITFYLLFKWTRSLCKTLFIPLMVIFLAILTASSHWLSRPHIFTFLFLTLWIIILNNLYQGKSNRWWLLPILMLFWVNFHGGFLAGFFTWFAYGVGIGWDTIREKRPENKFLPPYFWRNYLLGGVSSFIVSFIHPSGIDLWRIVVGHIGNNYIMDITDEFKSPNFHLSFTWPFLIFLILLLITLAYSKKKINSARLFSSLIWLAMGLYSGRNIPLFAIVSTPLLAEELDYLFINIPMRFPLLTRFKQTDSRILKIDEQVKGWIIPFLSIIIVVIGLTNGVDFDLQQKGYNFDSDRFPVEAVDWLEEHPQDGPMFNYFIWGGYILYREWPDIQVFIDGKTDLYGEALLKEYDQVITANYGWESVFKQHNITWAILPTDSLSVRTIQMDLGWNVIYEDETATILHR